MVETGNDGNRLTDPSGGQERSRMMRPLLRGNVENRSFSDYRDTDEDLLRKDTCERLLLIALPYVFMSLTRAVA